MAPMAPASRPAALLTLVAWALSSRAIDSEIPVDNEEYPSLDGYGYTLLHEEILKDEKRTKAYKDTILENIDMRGKIVADLGCGVGLMSLLSATAGASKVYCIDAANIAEAARRIISKNNMTDRIEVIEDRIENAIIPEGYVDVIISEWMGYFLFYEDMLPAVISFRDRYLSGDGLMLPSRARLWTSLYSDPHWHQNRIGYWENVYGFDYSFILERLKGEQFLAPERQHLRANGIVSEPALLLDLDIYKTSLKELEEISSNFKSTIGSNGKIHGIAFWFDIELTTPKATIVLDTSPSSGYNSWSQIIWYLKSAKTVRKGDVVSGSFEIKRTDISGEFDISLAMFKPWRLNLQSFDQGAHSIYQDLYERLEMEHAVSRYLLPARNNADLLIAVAIAFLLGTLTVYTFM